MGVGSRNHRIKLQYSKGKRIVNQFEKFDSTEDDELLAVLEQGGNIGEHDGDKKIIKEKNEISETVITINHQLQHALTHTSASAISNYPYTIGRAPPKLRKLHEHGFHPTLVAIGPLHCHDPHLKPLEAHKLRFLLRLLENMTLPHQADDDVHNQNGTLGKEVLEEIVSQQQVSNQNGASSSRTNGIEKKIEYLVVAMKELEADTRACYSETFRELSSSEFVMMMIFDSCFVIQLLRLYAKWGRSENHEDEPIFNTRWMVQSLKHDLIMLENQLPLPVLEKIFNITCPVGDRSTLKDLTLRFFNSLLPRQKAFSGMCTVDSTPNHLLGLLRSSFQVRNPPRDLSIGTDHPSSFRFWVRILLRRIDLATKGMKTFLRIRQTDHCEQEPSPPWVHDRELLIHCVTELKEAGISFKKRKNCELLDIEFKNGKLYIPPLLIDDYTGLMFLNFVAYEQCNPWTEPYFTTYLLFLDSLLNSSKDVEHLHSEGILDHVLGSDEDVAQLFNMLCREVVHDLGDCYLKKVLEDVNHYFRVRRHRWRAKWTHDYFSSPWAFISLIAAMFLLVLTFIQAFFAVLAYVVPPS